MVTAHGQHLKLPVFELFKRILFITIGAVLMGVGLEIFLVPNNIIDGGITGISIMLSYLTDIPLGIFLFLLNLPFLFLGYKQIGKTFALSTLYGVAVMSLTTYLLHEVDPITIDEFLASIFGGHGTRCRCRPRHPVRRLARRHGDCSDSVLQKAAVLSGRDCYVRQPVHSDQRRLCIQLGSRDVFPDRLLYCLQDDRYRHRGLRRVQGGVDHQ